MAPEIVFPNFGIEIQHLNRVAFSILGIEIYWYGIIIAIGIFLGLCITLREAKRTGQDTEFYTNSLVIATIVSLIFARIYYVVFSWGYYKNHLNEIFSFRNGGIAIYGAIIGAAITIVVYSKIKKLNFLKVADTYALGLLVGQIVGRWGNFINREAFGGYTNSLFAMRYLKSDVSSIHPTILENIINVNGVDYIQVHPTFLYESLWNIGVFIILNLFKRHKKFDGQLIAMYFIGYGIGRFWIEGLRTDSLFIGNSNIAISQVLSAILVIVFIVFIIFKTKYTKDVSEKGSD